MLAASERSAGKTYGAALADPKTGARRWWCQEEPPADVLDLRVENGDGLDVAGIDIVFSAVESDAARVLEPQYAKTAAVLSTASAFRYEDDVPILVPGVNLGHAAQIDVQRRRRGWSGFIVPLPNCTTMGLVVTLKPLLDRFGVERVVMTSMQGISGRAARPASRRSTSSTTSSRTSPARRRRSHARREDPRGPGEEASRRPRSPSARPAPEPPSAKGTPRRWPCRSDGAPAPPTWPRPSASSAASSRGSACRQRRSA